LAREGAVSLASSAGDGTVVFAERGDRSTVPAREVSPRRFAQGVVALCFGYLALQLAYILRLPLVMDEFQGAHDAYRFATGMPYRDFRPYKTVLGYYLQLPLLVLIKDPWLSLLAVKMQLAAMVTLALGAAAFLLSRCYSRRAVLLGLSLLVTMSTFLERSAELRVDMLTAIPGLFALVLLLHRKFAVAGLACGVSFLMSQKGIYYVISANAALATWGLLGGAPRQALMGWIRVNAGTGLVVGGYLLFWAGVADLQSVLDATFLSAGQVALGTDYSIKGFYWAQTLTRNGFFYALAAFGILRLLLLVRRRDGDVAKRALLLGYAVTLGGLCIWHKQPWPYFFVLLLPTLFVVHVAFFDQVERQGPVVAAQRRLRIVAFLLFGIALPLGRVPFVLVRDQGLQRTTVRVADALLEPGGTYLAAVDLFQRKEQAVQELRWLDRPRLTRLQQGSPEQQGRIVASLEQAPPRLWVDNYRIQALPQAIAGFLEAHYVHFWSNVYVYAPVLSPGQNTCEVPFDGEYRLEATGEHTPVLLDLDGRRLTVGDRITLPAGRMACSPEGTSRLVFWSGTSGLPLDPRYREVGNFFPRVYDY